MFSDEIILRDNLMYLDAWMKQNEALRGNLQVIDSDLVWTYLDEREKVSLKSFYLPELLYNEKFRNDLLDPKTMNAEDLFRIIRVHVLTSEFYKIIKRREKKYNHQNLKNGEK